jgi:sodium pump decarboxylase gamma subunit
MLNGLLANAGSDTAVSIPEAALYALLGFATVFLGIAFLILVVWLVGKVMSKPIVVPKTKKEEVAKEVKQEAVAPLETSEEISEETVAVITAAIMAYYQQTQAKCEFTVKRIKRI